MSDKSKRVNFNSLHVNHIRVHSDQDKTIPWPFHEFLLTTNQFSLIAQKKTPGKKASDEATKINSFINTFLNDISFANRETLPHSCSWTKIEFTDIPPTFKVQFRISMTWCTISWLFPDNADAPHGRIILPPWKWSPLFLLSSDWCKILSKSMAGINQTTTKLPCV